MYVIIISTLDNIRFSILRQFNQLNSLCILVEIFHNLLKMCILIYPSQSKSRDEIVNFNLDSQFLKLLDRLEVFLPEFNIPLSHLENEAHESFNLWNNGFDQGFPAHNRHNRTS